MLYLKRVFYNLAAIKNITKLELFGDWTLKIFGVFPLIIQKKHFQSRMRP